MKIKSLMIDNIQGIKHFEISEFSDNVTLLIGKVGAGKTTVLASIYSFFCDPEIIRWCECGGVNSLGKLSLEIKHNNNEIIELFTRINNLQFICGVHGNKDMDYSVQCIYLTDGICSKERR